MKKLKKLIESSAVIASLILITQITFADPPTPPGEHGQSGNGSPAGAPIDGGLSILLAMGGAYGARKLYKARKVKTSERVSE